MSERSRILVIDDETQITRVLKTALNAQGYEVRTATDGESGYLTCAKLRQCLPRIRVVLIGREKTPEAARFADFVGAALATEASVVEELHRLVLGALSEN